MSETKADFIRMYRMSGGFAADGERMWAIKCRDKAAPEMLAALRAIQQMALEDLRTDEHGSLWQIEADARAAIAKAEGQPEPPLAGSE